MQRLLKSAYCFFAALLLTTAAAAQHKICLLYTSDAADEL